MSSPLLMPSCKTTCRLTELGKQLDGTSVLWPDSLCHPISRCSSRASTARAAGSALVSSRNYKPLQPGMLWHLPTQQASHSCSQGTATTTKQDTSFRLMKRHLNTKYKEAKDLLGDSEAFRGRYLNMDAQSMGPQQLIFIKKLTSLRSLSRVTSCSP